MSHLALDVRETSFGDRLNPLFVKDVRQSLRGRGFAITFAITLLGAVGLIVRSVVDDPPGDPNAGMNLFVPAFSCLLIALLGYVPFSAFASMSRELDENAFDLLSLSDLRPTRIVLGKLLTAAVEALLFVSAFGPFLVFTYLLPGIDIALVVLAVAGAFLLSLALACIAIAIASGNRSRVQRSIAIVVLLGLVGFAVLPMLLRLLMWRVVGRTTLAAPSLESAFLFFTFVIAGGAFFYAAACSRLAHEEENRATAPRVVATALFVLLLGWCTHFYLSTHGHEALVVAAMCGLGVLGGTHVFGFTERDRLPRAVRARVPRNAVVAALASPFLPGGGRALSLFVAQSALACAWAILLCALVSPANIERTSWRIAWFALYLLAYIGLPSWLLAFATPNASANLRRLARLLICCFVAAVLVLPSVAAAFSRHPNRPNPFAPFWLREPTSWPFQFEGLLVLAFGGASIALNSRRIIGGVREVLAASRARREREIGA